MAPRNVPTLAASPFRRAGSRWPGTRLRFRKASPAARTVAWFCQGLAWGLVACSNQDASQRLRHPAKGPTDSVLAAMPVWTVELADGLAIGEVRGGAPNARSAAQFVRLSGAVRTPSGQFIVSDIGAGELLRFDSAGSFLSIVGRRGSGPAEFEAPGPPVPFTADSFAVVDMAKRRVTIFSPDGRPAATRGFALKTTVGILTPVGLQSGEVFIASLRVPRQPRAVGELYRDKVVIVRGSFRGSGLDTVAQTAGDEMIAGMWREAGQSEVVGYDLAFGSRAVVARVGSRLFVGNTSEPFIEGYSLLADSTIVLAWQPGTDPVSSEDRHNIYVQESTSVSATRGALGAPEQVGSVVAHFRDQPASSQMPAYTALLALGDGNLWIERYPRPWTATRSFLIADTLAGC